VSFAGTVGLGAVAGLTIIVGLSVARIGRPSRSRMAFLNAASIGVLLFLFYDVIKNASETITATLDSSRGRGIGYGLLLAAGLGTGLLGLVAFERAVLRRQAKTGPGAMAAAALAHPTAPEKTVREPLSAPYRLALFIAVGIGLHNFSEGLAIGQSARLGAYSLLYILVIGFGLHNTTEGFGITAPLLKLQPSWRFLGLLGAIGGGPTLLGTMVGFEFESPALSVLFLSLAAGAIVYVVGELQHAGRKIGAHDVAMAGLLVGFVAAYGTDLLLHVAGA
jgi:zinc transporter, ZIP family